jgi:hypothetical protein
MFINKFTQNKKIVFVVPVHHFLFHVLLLVRKANNSAGELPAVYFKLSFFLHFSLQNSALTQCSPKTTRKIEPRELRKGVLVFYFHGR